MATLACNAPMRIRAGMRLTILTVDQLAPQLLIDLEKLFHSEGFDQARLTQAFAEREDDSTWWVARFNDRHLAAAVTCRQGNRAVIQALKVRDFTRRRGIGRYLVQQLERWARESGLAHLVVASELASADMVAFLEAEGFEQAADKQYAKKL